MVLFHRNLFLPGSDVAESKIKRAIFDAGDHVDQLIAAVQAATAQLVPAVKSLFLAKLGVTGIAGVGSGGVGGSDRRFLAYLSQVRIEGEHKIYGRIADSGFEIRFHFCPNCGSSVFWEGDRSPTTCCIAVGCFADPDFPAPTSSGWEEAMHPWLGLPPETAHFPQARS